MYKKIITHITILILIVLAVSCESEAGAIYENKDDVKFSFKSKKYITELTAEDGNELSVTVLRTNTKGNAEVDIFFESSDPLFSLSSTKAQFSDGEGSTSLKISHPGSDELGIGTTYTLKISIDEDVTSDGGINEIEFKVSRKLTWENMGKAVFTSNDIYGGQSYDVEIESPIEAPHIYKAIELYDEGFDVLIYVDKTAGTAQIPHQPIGLAGLFGADYPMTYLRADACVYDNGTITITPGNENNYNRLIVVPAPGTLGAWITVPEILVLPAGSY